MLGLSQREFGELAGLRQMHVSKIENGQCPSIEIADRIMSNLGLRLVLGSGRRRFYMEGET